MPVQSNSPSSANCGSSQAALHPRRTLCARTPSLVTFRWSVDRSEFERGVRLILIRGARGAAHGPNEQTGERQSRRGRSADPGGTAETPSGATTPGPSYASTAGLASGDRPGSRSPHRRRPRRARRADASRGDGGSTSPASGEPSATSRISGRAFWMAPSSARFRAGSVVEASLGKTGAAMPATSRPGASAHRTPPLARPLQALHCTGRSATTLWPRGSRGASAGRRR